MQTRRRKRAGNSLTSSNDEKFQVTDAKSSVTAVIVQNVRDELRDEFLASQRELHDAASKFPGFRLTKVYSPTSATNDWVVVIHFETSDQLAAWLDSPIRQKHANKARETFGEFTLRRPGFDSWFGPQPIPSWKMACSVLFGLYPTVMLLTFFWPGPLFRGLSPAEQLAIGNVLSITLLQWIVMPVLTSVLAFWLQPKGLSKFAAVMTPIGLGFIFLGMVWLFNTIGLG